MLIKALLTELIPFIPDLIKEVSKGITEAQNWLSDEVDYNSIKELSDDEIKLKGKDK